MNEDGAPASPWIQFVVVQGHFNDLWFAVRMSIDTEMSIWKYVSEGLQNFRSVV